MKKKDMKCACGRIATYHEHLRFNAYDVDGWVCKNCGETFYNPEKAERILLLNKLKKARYQLKLSKVKSNLILRIPKEVGQAMDLHKGEEVELRLKKSDEMIVHPLPAR